MKEECIILLYWRPRTETGQLRIIGSRGGEGVENE